MAYLVFEMDKGKAEIVDERLMEFVNWRYAAGRIMGRAETLEEARDNIRRAGMRVQAKVLLRGGSLEVTAELVGRFSEIALSYSLDPAQFVFDVLWPTLPESIRKELAA